MKSIDVKPSKHANFNNENNKEGLKFNVGYNVRILKY